MHVRTRSVCVFDTVDSRVSFISVKVTHWQIKIKKPVLAVKYLPGLMHTAHAL